MPFLKADDLRFKKSLPSSWLTLIASYLAITQPIRNCSIWLMLHALIVEPIPNEFNELLSFLVSLKIIISLLTF